MKKLNTDNLSQRNALGMERDCQHGLYKAGMGSSRVLSDFAEKYGSKNRVLAGFGIGGKSGKEKRSMGTKQGVAGFGIGGKSGKEKVYKLGCDRERLKMIKAILSGADNRPPMLEKDMYDSWKSRMELYMMNRQHGRMILESVENGPLIWPTIEENGVTRPRKYSELSATDAIQADCDVKATNIILQGLPPEVYALVSNHRITKELWERIQLLMQGTSLTKQERECKLHEHLQCETRTISSKHQVFEYSSS
ncbi:hypothetical protein Tco_0864478 [Tanacetum coccineum]